MTPAVRQTDGSKKATGSSTPSLAPSSPENSHPTTPAPGPKSPPAKSAVRNGGPTCNDRSACALKWIRRDELEREDARNPREISRVARDERRPKFPARSRDEDV